MPRDGSSTVKILVVDDEKAVADSTVLVFERQGYEARAAYSAEEALPCIREFQPDLLLADVKMTGMNGIELAIKMCSDMPECKLLLISGQAETADLLEEARSRGYEFEILAKPVSPKDLLAKVAEMTGEKKG